MRKALKKKCGIGFVIVNGENLAGGSGITAATVEEVFGHGVDVITTGDHVFKKKGAEILLSENSRILRPANYPARVPGQGSSIVNAGNGFKVGVVNLMGRIFMKALDCRHLKP